MNPGKRFFRKLAPESLFGRIFWGVFAASLLSVFILWGWLNSRVYSALDQEASLRLKRIAEIMLAELAISDKKDKSRQIQAMQSFWQLEQAGGLLQNFYWLDVSGKSASFIASYSREYLAETSMLPPTADEAEELVFDYINELDRGEMVFPDPYSGASRRFKIILCPVLDLNGLLAGVIGIESDMEYLRLVSEFRHFLAEGIVFSMLLSLLVAIVLARNISGKISCLAGGVQLIAKGARPEEIKLSISELDHLYQAFFRMGVELEQQKKHVQQVFMRKLDELAFTGGAIAHEIRNPLSAIEMHFGLLKRELLKINQSAEFSSSIEEINQQLMHLRKLLTSFLNYSRKVQPQPEPVDPELFFKALVLAKKKTLGEFSCEIDIKEKMRVYIDPTMFQQIFDNLLNNSFRATSGLNLVIYFSAHLRDNMLKIVFADNGPGVPAGMREKLFTPFATGNPDGSGFGLALVRKLVEAHGGELNYNDGAAGGAVFIIEVPQHENSCS
ncbi:MAG: HAMP domain-containing histidine kinase [Erysipelotrichia bacterium]|nr:HAMP domain-containing histidine kinase [Erysipelotrichia bacterium]